MIRIKKAVKVYLTKKMIRAYRRDKPEIVKPVVKYITANWFTKRKIVDFETYSSKNPAKVEVLLNHKSKLNYSGIPFYPEETIEKELFEVEGVSSALKLKDVNIIGGSSLIMVDSEYAIYDIKSQDKTGNIDFSDEGVVYYKGDDFHFLNPKISGSIANGILLVSNYSTNYYHFLFETVVKFKGLLELDLPVEIPILVDERCLNVPQYVEVLNYFGKGRKLLAIEKNAVYNVKELYHFNTPNIIPPNFLKITALKSSAVLFSPDSILFLRNNLLKLKASGNRFSTRVFISRKNASARRAYNESEIFKVLEQFNFTVYYPETLSIAEQIELFSNADIIVGATGAAFSNIVCSKKGSKVVCLTNYRVNLTIFSTIAKLVNIHLTYLFDTTLKLNDTSDLHEPFRIDPIVLEHLLESYNI